MKTIYLCGGINNLTDKECKDWREYTKEQLKGQYNFLDPMRRDYRGKEKDSVKEIVEGDYVDLDTSDIVLVMANRPSWGTAMECHYAFSQRWHGNLGIFPKVYVVCDNESPSPWLVYHSDKIFKTLDEAILQLQVDIWAKDSIDQKTRNEVYTGQTNDD